MLVRAIPRKRNLPKIQILLAICLKKKQQQKANDARGIGKFTNVEIAEKLDAAMSKKGKDVYEVKCLACHKLTDEKVVGPGWKDVTKRRTAEWIMNFSTNTDEMLNKDAEAQAMLEICMVRMPNQNITDDEARSVYEFMRENDGVK
jgi:cytochrome c551/c552